MAAQFGLLINEIGSLYQKDLWRAFVQECQASGNQPCAIIGKSWKSPRDNEMVHNELFHLVPLLHLDGMVVAESVLSTHTPFHEVEAICGLSAGTTVYLGEAPTAQRACIRFRSALGVKDAIRHLHKKHLCSQIGCVTGVLANPDVVERLQAWREVMQELKLVWLDREEDGLFTSEGGAEAAMRLLKRHTNLEAIFFMNDTMAIGAQQSMEEFSPQFDHVRLIGMDDIAESRWLIKPLSSIRQPSADMLKKAVQVIRSGKADLAGKIDFDGKLVPRDSCGCPHPEKESGRNEFIREQMQVYFQTRLIRRAAQALFSDLENATWEIRLAQAFQRAQVGWVAVVEWDPALPPSTHAAKGTLRWLEYNQGELDYTTSRRSEISRHFSDRIRTREHALAIHPLVCEQQFLGVVILESSPSLESFYEPLFLQVAAALHGTRIVKAQQNMAHDLQLANQQLTQLSNRDELTGALNRRGFHLLAEQVLHDSRRSKKLTAICFLDMDKLKLINDVHGHAEGDRAIQAIANAIRQSLRRNDIFARIGGDEFVFLAQLKEEADYKQILKRARQSLEIQQQQFPESIRLSFSAGIALSHPTDRRSLDELLQEADTSLYEAKQRRES